MQLPRSLRLLWSKYEYDDQGRKRFGAWSQAYSGERYWSLDPLPEEVHLIDIAQGLVNANRYRGQTKEPYNVLTHSVVVSRAVSLLARERGFSEADAKAIGFQGLMHDATEAYLGDVARPLKRMPAMKEYCRVEKLWEDAIFKRFGIHPTEESNALVHEVDHRIVLDEIKVLMRDPDMWARGKRYVGVEPMNAWIPNWNREQSLNQFYNRFDELRPGWTEDNGNNEAIPEVVSA